MRSSPSRTSPTRATRDDAGRTVPAHWWRGAARPSERSPRDPFAQQRVDDDVLIAFFEDQILFEKRGKRGLDAGRSPKTIAAANLDRKSTRLNSSHLGISYA